MVLLEPIVGLAELLQGQNVDTLIARVQALRALLAPGP